MTNGEGWPREFVTALDDAKARTARRLVCHEIATFLVSLGRSLWVGGWLLTDDAMRGLAVLVQIGGELAVSRTKVLDAGHYYAAAVLVPPLFVAEYFALGIGSC